MQLIDMPAEIMTDLQAVGVERVALNFFKKDGMLELIVNTAPNTPDAKTMEKLKDWAHSVYKPRCHNYSYEASEHVIYDFVTRQMEYSEFYSARRDGEKTVKKF